MASVVTHTFSAMGIDGHAAKLIPVDSLLKTAKMLRVSAGKPS
jgi:hypothetical protein